MDKYGLIGYPLKHSFSPEIHNPAFKALNIPAMYSKIEISIAEFDGTISKLKDSEYIGFNVTVPFKQKIIPFLDMIVPLAQKIRAVNTIKKVGKEWHGYNTDVIGFLYPLKDLKQEIKTVLIIGAGGAANAVAFGLIDFYKTLNNMTICNRTIKNAHNLKQLLEITCSIQIKTAPLDDAPQLTEQYDLIVNTTNIGMGTLKHLTPLEISTLSHANTIIYDLIYNPKETLFLKSAKNKGLKTINGLPMLIGQAQESFKIWTSKKYPDSILDLNMFYK